MIVLLILILQIYDSKNESYNKTQSTYTLILLTKRNQETLNTRYCIKHFNKKAFKKGHQTDELMKRKLFLIKKKKKKAEKIK